MLTCCQESSRSWNVNVAVTPHVACNFLMYKKFDTSVASAWTAVGSLDCFSCFAALLLLTLLVTMSMIWR